MSVTLELHHCPPLREYGPNDIQRFFGKVSIQSVEKYHDCCYHLVFATAQEARKAIREYNDAPLFRYFKRETKNYRFHLRFPRSNGESGTWTKIENLVESAVLVAKNLRECEQKLSNFFTQLYNFHVDARQLCRKSDFKEMRESMETVANNANEKISQVYELCFNRYSQQYRDSWSNLCTFSKPALSEDALCKRLNDVAAPAWVTGADKQAAFLVGVSSTMQSEFRDAILSLVTEEQKDKVKFGSLKGVERARAKIEESKCQQREGVRAVRSVMDLLRCAIPAASPERVLEQFDILHSDPRFSTLLVFKNKFNTQENPGVSQPPCLHCNFLFSPRQGDPGTVVEVQISLPDFFAIKEHHHKVFEIGRRNKANPLEWLICPWNEPPTKCKLMNTADEYALYQAIFDREHVSMAGGQYGEGPLHLAASRGIVEIVKFVLHTKVSVNLENQFLLTPLHSAATKGQIEVMKVLLDHGANLDAKDYRGRTPLHYCARNDYGEAADLLLRSRASINAQDSRLCTPLFYAHQYNKDNMVSFLLEHQASGIIMNEKGGTYASKDAVVEDDIKDCPCGQYLGMQADCRRWKLGTCAQNPCSFAHDPSKRGTKKNPKNQRHGVEPMFFVPNAGPKQNAKNQAEAPVKPCRYWKNGSCLSGEQCPFEHARFSERKQDAEINDDSVAELCWHWAKKGFCFRFLENNCRFNHDPKAKFSARNKQDANDDASDEESVPVSSWHQGSGHVGDKCKNNHSIYLGDVLDESEHPFGDDEAEVSQEMQDKATELGHEGDAFKAEHRYAEAILKYNEAIKLETTARLVATRSLCFLALNKPNACIFDCDHALKTNPNSTRAFTARGQAYALLYKWEEAYKDLSKAQACDYNADTAAKLKDIEVKLHEQQAKEKERAAKAEERAAKMAAMAAKLAAIKEGAARTSYTTYMHTRSFE